VTSTSEAPKAKSILVLGGGPAGLYFALLAKKADPACCVTLVERNPADVTYGWGVVFSDRTLASFQRADYKTYEQITRNFVIWDAIDVRYRGQTIRCGGHVIASISRKKLLNILQERCAELGVQLHFGVDVHSLDELAPYGECDLLVAADGVNSLVRRLYEAEFKPRIEMGRARYIWLGADKVLDAFTFIFHANEHGLFQVHAYPFSGTTSTFIVECDEQTWQNAGLDKATEEESLAYCQHLLDADLNGAHLQSNSSKWISFPTLKTQNWRGRNFEFRISNFEFEDAESSPQIRNSKFEIRNLVLMGDAAHTAHFSIGSGTKLAMEDAIALANAIEQYGDLATALDEYELERKPVVETFQRAARESQTYFETIKRYLNLDPVPFAFQLLTRSGRITYDDLHFRDTRFGDMVDAWMWAESGQQSAVSGQPPSPTSPRPLAPSPSSSIVHRPSSHPLVAPSPMFGPYSLRDMCLRNRVVMSPRLQNCVVEGLAAGEYVEVLSRCAEGGAGLVLTDICAVLPEGRITPCDLGLYDEQQMGVWKGLVEWLHSRSSAKVGAQLGHAGRRGSTRPRWEGLDRPLRDGGWPLVSASPLPYTPISQVPGEMDRAEMERVRATFVSAARLADQAGFDLLQLHMAHGYLLASFLSPLTNQRADEYGGESENCARYPLEVLEAVRAVWPQGKPLSVALSASDYVKGGFEVEDAVRVAGWLKERGCDLVQVLAGQTTPGGEPPYARGFLTPLADRVRNEAGVPVMVGGYITNSNEANTIIAAGRGDLCVMEVQ
jgi:anthraniloyl-CoA monooxygenase